MDGRNFDAIFGLGPLKAKTLDCRNDQSGYCKQCVDLSEWVQKQSLIHLWSFVGSWRKFQVQCKIGFCKGCVGDCTGKSSWFAKSSKQLLWCSEANLGLFRARNSSYFYSRFVEPGKSAPRKYSFHSEGCSAGETFARIWPKLCSLRSWRLR